MVSAQQLPPEARFMTRVGVDFDTGCWPYTGNLDRDGYGRVHIRGKYRMAHRAAYWLFHGPIPPGLHVDHLCYVRNCVNPEHLEAVTPAENVRRKEARLKAVDPLRGTRAKDRSRWRPDPEKERERHRLESERLKARTAEQIEADRQRLRPDGLKRCAGCREQLDFDEFHRDRYRVDGLESRCKACS